MEERLDRIEKMLATLILKVGNIYDEQLSMKQELTSIKQDQTSMKQELTLIKQDQTSMKQELTSIKQDQTSMKQDQTSLWQEVLSMKENLEQMRSESKERHHEIIYKLEALEADHEHTWEKSVRNEREIAKIKKQFEL